MAKEPIITERTGGAYEADPKTGKVRRVEPEMKLPEIPQPVAAPASEPAPALVPATEKEG